MQRLRFVLAVSVLLSSVGVGCGGGAGNGGGGGGGPMPPPPTLTSVVPAAGFTVGGQPVRIMGTGFTGATSVSFGGVLAIGVQVLDDQTILCTTPPGAAGLALVSVTAPGGTVSAALFTYLAYPPVAAMDLQVDNDMLPGGDSPYLCDSPAIKCDGPNVYVVWAEARGAATAFDVFFRRSTDGGATWAGPDVRLNTNAAQASDSRTPVVCCNGSDVFVCWLDSRNGAYEAFVNSSSDGGATWRTVDARVSQAMTSTSFFSAPQPCCLGGVLHVTWGEVDRATGGLVYRYQRTADGGTSWLATDVNLGGFNQDGSIGTTAHRFCCSASGMHMVWADDRNGDWDVWHTRSIDGGATWSADQRVDRDTTGRNAGVGSSRSLQACCDGGRLYVAWHDDRAAVTPGAAYDIYFNASIDGGATFGATDSRANAQPFTGANAVQALSIAMCCGGGTAHVVSWDNRPVSPATTNGPSNFYYQRTSDNGATWLAADRLLPLAGGGQHFLDPQICCSGPNLHVLNSELGGGANGDVYVNSSPDGGTTWPAAGTRIDSNVPADGLATFGLHGYPAISCQGARPLVVWFDDRRGAAPGAGGASDIYLGTFR